MSYRSLASVINYSNGTGVIASLSGERKVTDTLVWILYSYSVTKCLPIIIIIAWPHDQDEVNMGK